MVHRHLTLLLCLVPVLVTAQGTPPASVQQPAGTLPDCPELARALTAVVRNDARLRDWPQLGRYRDANRSLAAPRAGERRVVFMGDSITDAWQDHQRFGGMFAPGRPYVNRGISGQTTPQMLVRFRPDVLDLGPAVVVILAGTNDVAGNTGPMTNDEIQANLASMSELAKAHGVRVVLASILPVSNYHAAPSGPAPETSQRPMARIQAINTWIRSYAEREGHVYLDYAAAMTDANGLLREDLSADDLHPNATGYAIMAPLAETAVAKALAGTTSGNRER